MNLMASAFVALRANKAAVTGNQEVMTFGDTQPQDISVNICEAADAKDLGPGAWTQDGDIIAQALVSDFLQPLKRGFQPAVKWGSQTSLYLKSYVERDGIYTLTISDRTKAK